MQTLYRRCCSLDVHKASISACLPIDREDGKRPEERKRTFETYTDDLVRLRTWLTQCKVAHVAMESTGVYWKPVWNILEPGKFEKVPVNPQHFHGLPGRKTDPKDSRWIAELLSYGLLRLPHRSRRRSLPRGGRRLLRPAARGAHSTQTRKTARETRP